MHVRVFFCELKAPGGSCTWWSLLNSYDKANPTSLYGYTVWPKRKQLKNLFYLRKCDIKPTFVYQNYMELFPVRWLNRLGTGAGCGRTCSAMFRI